jgi:O-antigen ligase
MAFPFAIAAAFRATAKMRLVAVLTAAVCAFVLVRTGSRGGTLAFAVGGLVFLLGLRGRRRAIAFGAVVVAMALGWQLAPQDYRDRVASMTSVEDDYNYTAYSGRRQIWSRAVGYIVEHPIAGVGAGNFPIAEGDFAAASGIVAKWSAAHNAYVQAFAELGLVGGVLFCSLVLLTFHRSWRLWRQGESRTRWKCPELFPSVCAFMTSALFLSHAYFYPFFALAGLVALAARVQPAPEELQASVQSRTVFSRPKAWRTNRRGRVAVSA